nr:right-handed parallel beta-helix repeat-containing protein [bacterium]
MAQGRAVAAAVAAFSAISVSARGAEIVVAPSGGDYTSIQAALDAADAGDTVTVLSGTYREAPVFPRSGSEASGSITLRAGPGETAVVDPQAEGDVITVADRSYVRIVGFEITNSHAGAGIMVRGKGDRIEIADNRIYGLPGADAIGIMILGDDPVPLSGIVVSGNEIHDCEPAPSEALVLNGNVSGFEVVDNVVRDVNNIGIDFIGGESWTGNHGVARDGVCRGNRVYRARSVYGGGYAAGIYVDGGRDIVIEGNLVHECDLGIEIGAENPGYTVTGVVVRNNVVYANDKAGIVFGGYEAELGRVDGCEFSGNTLYHNDTLADGNGEFAVNWAEGNRVRNNIVVAGPQNLLIRAETGSVDNGFDWNLYYADAGAEAVAVDWQGVRYTGFEQYRAAVGQDQHSGFADPLLDAPAAGAVRLAGGSPAIQAGDMESPDLLGAADCYGNPRVRGGRVDIGAAEADILPGAGSGDYDGDGTADVAVFRPSSGAWLVRGLTRTWFGGDGDLPVPRDYSGDGTWEPA